MISRKHKAVLVIAFCTGIVLVVFLFLYKNGGSQVAIVNAVPSARGAVQLKNVALPISEHTASGAPHSSSALDDDVQKRAMYAEHPAMREAAIKSISLDYAEYFQNAKLSKKERDVVFNILVDSLASGSVSDVKDYNTLLEQVLGRERYNEMLKYDEYYPKRNRANEAISEISVGAGLSQEKHDALYNALMEVPVSNPEYLSALKSVYAGGGADGELVRQSYANYFTQAMQKYEVNKVLTDAENKALIAWYGRIAQRSVDSIESLKNIIAANPNLKYHSP